MDIIEDTITKASQGDLDAFEAIYKAMSGFVYNIALRMVNNREDAEEVTQEVFLMVHRKLKDFRMESSLKTWVYRITVNHAINHAKRAAKHKQHLEYNDELIPQAIGAGEASMTLDDAHHKKVIDELLSHINDEQKACIVLRNLEGLSYAQIAEVLKININTVRTRLKRAREKMLPLRRATYDAL